MQEKVKERKEKERKILSGLTPYQTPSEMMENEHLVQIQKKITYMYSERQFKLKRSVFAGGLGLKRGKSGMLINKKGLEELPIWMAEKFNQVIKEKSVV